MSNLSYYEMRVEMCRIAKQMWDRRLTNAAGGNFAVRVDENRILITPSLMSERLHCEMQPSDLLLIDYEQNILEGTAKLSREGEMHVDILKNFKNIGATIHAHPFWCMPYVSQARPIPNVTEATMGRGSVGCIPYTKAYTPQLAENVYRYFEEHRELAERKPIGVILPLHGVVVSGPDLWLAYSMLERIECDAFCGIAHDIVAQVPPDSVLG
ncbi:class II aldolase/adducin family protein [Feifania hominis]|uniref:Class II aldolase/adducin family protein n=1 Tax=Feifania hominis TaxID=2763660 RepID=A0A926DEZ0_9FIRM|nr:class II aldolase/adducin family protein [Feifania hominis]MBC8536908.1 class II aldolase/adducin family protein [Feifania hominis]